MALDINTTNNININVNPGNAVRPGANTPEKDTAVRDAAVKNGADSDRENAIKKAAEAMSEAAGKAVEEIKSTQEKAPDDDKLAIKETSEYGDELKVTNEGAMSSQAGGTVIASDEDGLVAEQNKVSIEANEEAMEAMRAQIQETKDNQAKAMEQMKATAEANAERAKERNDLRDAENEAAEARKSVLIEEASQNGNSVVETAKQQEHVDNLTGLSKSQVEQLYRDGRITQYEYQQNMESREAAAEAVEANGQQNAELVKETLANEAVVAASEALVSAVDNGNTAVMEAALGITPEEDTPQILIQPVVKS
ncbi:MAG: hypothetical protein K6E68_07405 [Lachnospiraceae bacterium]|nr:hypothetical protein [Lachnospiraceae bacterium]